MYRVTPLTYLIDGMLATGVANTAITCARKEYLRMEPAANQTCGQYLSPYIAQFGGYLLDPDASTGCQYCTFSESNALLKTLSSDYALRWRNFGIMWGYIVFNIVAAIGIYWLVRVPKKPRNAKTEKTA